ncbi:TonB family protein [Methylobacterium sp. Leaf85]|uniref:TonB family protein n=1 Tax=Methylobacterium sp. Leaf85 TaxID=1736241 RepID=UPI0009EBA078
MMNIAIPLHAHCGREQALLVQERRDRRFRGMVWILAALLVGGVHAGIVCYLIREKQLAIPLPAEAGAVMIDLAPEVQQATSQTDAAVAKPEEEAAAPAVEAPPPEEEEEPKPAAGVEEAPVPAIVPLAPTSREKPRQGKDKPHKASEKAIKKPPAKPKASPKPSHAAAVRTASAPRSDQRAASTTAMSSGASSASSNADWKSQVAAALNRNKRFPIGVQATGSPALRMLISASGQVSAASIVISSGSAELDRAAMDTVYRSSPLPPPPSGPTSLTFRMNFRSR